MVLKQHAGCDAFFRVSRIMLRAPTEHARFSLGAWRAVGLLRENGVVLNN